MTFVKGSQAEKFKTQTFDENLDFLFTPSAISNSPKIQSLRKAYISDALEKNKNIRQPPSIYTRNNISKHIR